MFENSGCVLISVSKLVTNNAWTFWRCGWSCISRVEVLCEHICMIRTYLFTMVADNNSQWKNSVMEFSLWIMVEQDWGSCYISRIDIWWSLKVTNNITHWYIEIYSVYMMINLDSSCLCSVRLYGGSEILINYMNCVTG